MSDSLRVQSVIFERFEHSDDKLLVVWNYENGCVTRHNCYDEDVQQLMKDFFINSRRE